MTVAELIAALSEFPGDMRVIAGSDEEGNDFIDPYTPQVSWFAPDTGYRCGYYLVDEDDVADGEYEGVELVKMVLM